MLQIGVRQQQQWGRLMACPGWVLPERCGGWVGKDRVDFNRGASSSGGGGRLRSRRGRREVVAMKTGGEESRDIEVDGLLAEDGGVAPGLKQMSSVNTTINKASKWVAVLVATGALLWRHDEHALWFAIGSIMNGGIAKGLKYLINESRPPTADGVKEDPGMPSSHAQGFSYLGTYGSLALLLWQGAKAWTILVSAGLLLSLAYTTWLRVLEGLHTVTQVVAGTIIGIATATFWLWVWKAGAEAAVESSSSVKLILYLSFVVACILCYFISFKDWQFGEP